MQTITVHVDVQKGILQALIRDTPLILHTLAQYCPIPLKKRLIVLTMNSIFFTALH